nr:hypothetical protein [Angustibacter aerolatus]
MHPTGPRQLPLPAEVARTLLHGLGRATVSGPLDDRPDDAACSPGPAHGVADGATAVPAVHGALPDGTVVLALPADATVRLLPGGGEPEGRALRLCVRAEAPLPDLTLPRAHLEVLGWAARARPGQRAGALEALAATWPITNLLAHAPRHDLLLVDVAEVEPALGRRVRHPRRRRRPRRRGRPGRGRGGRAARRGAEQVRAPGARGGPRPGRAAGAGRWHRAARPHARRAGHRPRPVRPDRAGAGGRRPRRRAARRPAAVRQAGRGRRERAADRRHRACSPSGPATRRAAGSASAAAQDLAEPLQP